MLHTAHNASFAGKRSIASRRVADGWHRHEAKSNGGCLRGCEHYDNERNPKKRMLGWRSLSVDTAFSRINAPLVCPFPFLLRKVYIDIRYNDSDLHHMD
jgi:hypothetical protein